MADIQIDINPTNVQGSIPCLAIATSIELHKWMSQQGIPNGSNPH